VYQRFSWQVPARRQFWIEIGEQKPHLKDGKLSATAALNFFRSIVTFSRGWRPEFA